VDEAAVVGGCQARHRADHGCTARGDFFSARRLDDAPGSEKRAAQLRDTYARRLDAAIAPGDLLVRGDLTKTGGAQDGGERSHGVEGGSSQ
jgi:hypothetical protein